MASAVGRTLMAEGLDYLASESELSFAEGVRSQRGGLVSQDPAPEYDQ